MTTERDVPRTDEWAFVEREYQLRVTLSAVDGGWRASICDVPRQGRLWPDDPWGTQVESRTLSDLCQGIARQLRLHELHEHQAVLRRKSASS